MEREALNLALDLATMHHTDNGYAELRAKVRSAIKEALAQPEQEPVAKYCCHVCFDKSGQTFLDRMIL